MVLLLHWNILVKGMVTYCSCMHAAVYVAYSMLLFNNEIVLMTNDVLFKGLLHRDTIILTAFDILFSLSCRAD